MTGSSADDSRHCLVIANPQAGGLTSDLVADVGQRCARHGAVQVQRTYSRGDATRIAQAAAALPPRQRFRVVVAVGGDGTVLEVVRGLLAGGASATGPALFVVPAGTGNSNYRSHWGTWPWQQALDYALADPDRSARPLDLARVRELDEPVVLGAGAGLTAEVLRSAGEVQLAGRARLQAGLERAAASFTPYAGRVTVDGRVVHEGDTVFANVGGGRHRAWQYLVLPASVLDDGQLDVCVVGVGVDPVDVPALLLDGKHVGRPGVVYERGRSVVVERTDGLPLVFEHDGELLRHDRSRLTVDVLPRALPVLCQPVLAAAGQETP
ncbi:diacylglycerol kinase catalytic region [Parafrankia sp. EAN1pec]|uniref:diacylglycerol/lipid kinase family protein n=1 Tax=Parafrankia sp. (strain EAN1pec) TaxID=298653 RepID=UPI0000543578|nr:diacylglycerol kinase catalytic region [Frankia sp. EAN1pec]